MSKYGGYLFLFDEVKRATLLHEQALYDSAFRLIDYVSAPDWQPKASEIALISFEPGELNFLSLVTRKHKAAIAKYQIEFSHFYHLTPLPFSEIEANIGPRFRRHFISIATGEGRQVPPGTWSQLVATIKTLRPDAAEALDHLDDLRQQVGVIIREPGFDIVAQEKDAVGLALEIFGGERVRRRELGQWTGEVNNPTSFLTGLKQMPLLEDRMIENDARVFGDWVPAEAHRWGIEFQRDGEKLTIVNANRHGIERTLGVDLVYYHHRFASFIMVQYKRMTLEDDQVFRYRASDESYRQELARMQAFAALHPPSRSLARLEDYRLHSNGFYFKLCPAIDFRPYAADIIRGMYIPLDYWESLIAAPEARGPRGGIGITYDNVGRYITNTLFIDLVQEGWIGTKVEATASLEEILRYSLESGHSLILAHSSTV